MANLTADRSSLKKDGKLISLPLKANAVIYKGALTCVNAGYLIRGASAANNAFTGVAYEKVDNTGGADGAKSGRVETDGTHVFTGDGAAADLGKEMYISDDQTVTKDAPANGVKCGRLVEVPAAGVNRIKIDGYALA
ncbi:MAG: hypothetical protein RDU41_09565 [Clostridia bacterium]|nr:hypothetical protein [Clostridia bacterium]